MFNINGIEWNIRFVNPNSSLLLRSDGTATLGVTDANDRCIYINDRLSDYMLEKVICHEIVHCFCFAYNIKMPIETEEYMADFIANYGFEIVELAETILYNYSYNSKGEV